MTNDLDHVVEFLAVFFVGISALLVLMVRLEAAITQPKVAERRAVPAVTPGEAPSTVVAATDV